jgi:hypothetical protein
VPHGATGRARFDADHAGARKALRSPLLAYYEGGRLVYAGRAGAGLTEREIRDLRQRLEPLVVPKMPLASVSGGGEPLLRLICSTVVNKRTGEPGASFDDYFNGLRARIRRCLASPGAAPPAPPRRRLFRASTIREADPWLTSAWADFEQFSA